MEIITLNEARAKDLTYYFTGKPCSKGHMAKRLTSARACIDCMYARTQAKRDKNRVTHIECQHCGVQTPRPIGKSNKRFCSLACRNKARDRSGELQNPERRIAHAFRVRVKNVLKAGRMQRSAALLGCTYQELLKHLESQFQDGMSWDNYGEWHIDHIRPCASFDLLDPEQQAQCFHYTNLQPLWAEDNLRKGARYQ